jgi:gamma-glutamyltranspeptidase/glutathione hydrolase
MVASVHPLASHAGLQVLKNGGNAIDAAVATSAVMGVVAPQYSGLGGGGFILVHLFGTSKTVAIDCREVAPAKAHGDLFKIADVQSLRALGGSEAAASANRLGYKAVGVPGNLAGLCSILDQYGTKSLKELLQSAVEIAENGFPVSRRLGNILAENIDDAYAKSKLFQATGKIYLRDGRTYAVNEMMTNRDLARTLQRIGEEGMDVFYEGDIAEAIDQDMAEHDGLVTKADLRDYEPKSKKPILGNYRGYDLLTMPPPGGGVTIVEILNILEEFDLKKLGHNTMQSIKVISETMMQAFADKSMNVADPDFAELGYEHLLSKDYAKRIARKLDLADSLPRWGTQQSDRGSTVHFSVIDKDRNVVAMTESIVLLWLRSCR